jgi:vacuolar-type H+-ATPase subunit F/Vma7
MPLRVVYLGDELSAAGFALAGVTAQVPPPGEESAWLHRAMREAKLVIVGQHCAASIPPAELETALASVSPMVMVLPEYDGTAAPNDPASRIRRLLGVEA